MTRSAIALLTLSLGACAASNENLAPSQAITTAEASIGEAERAGAAEYSARELDQARQKLTLARAASSDEEFEDAVQLAEKSAADAELAAALARVGQSEEAVEEIRASIQALRAETTR